ncbi:MAG: CopG family ribbon-helix-helix protein [Thermoleophilaceae bacterium]
MAKVMVSMPDELLEQVDSAAAERRTTRSGFLQGAARAALGDPSATERRERVAGVIGALHARHLRADAPSAEQAVRALRDRDDPPR